MPSTAQERAAFRAARRAIPVVPDVAEVRTLLGVLTTLMRREERTVPSRKGGGWATEVVPAVTTPAEAWDFRNRAVYCLVGMVARDQFDQANVEAVEAVLDGRMRVADDWSDSWFAHLTEMLEADA